MKTPNSSVALASPDGIDPTTRFEVLRELEELEASQNLDARVVDNARTLIPKLWEIHPVRFEVYVSERNGIVIEVPTRRSGSVGIECCERDIVYCFVTVDGNNRYAKFYQLDGLPDPFMTKALRDLAAGSNRRGSAGARGSGGTCNFGERR